MRFLQLVQRQMPSSATSPDTSIEQSPQQQRAMREALMWINPFCNSRCRPSEPKLMDVVFGIEIIEVGLPVVTCQLQIL